MEERERIRFSVPLPVGRELEYVADATAAGRLAMSGPFSERVAGMLQDELGAQGVVLTTSCTDALELAAMLLDVRPGDVVVVPSFTFVSTALAFVRQGARIRFCDIEPDTLGLSPSHLQQLLDDDVRVVVPVHYAGIGCDMAGISNVVHNTNVEIVEDNAHGLFGQLENRPLGSFGRMSTLSFHETKNFVCGEGGALVMNSPDDVERAHVLRDKGTNRQAFLEGAVDKYTWVDSGSSFGMADLLAAYLCAQLEERDRILAARRQVTTWYRERLGAVLPEFGAAVPEIPPARVSGYHMFHLLMANREQRDRAINDLAAANIQATFHYVPLHSSRAGRAFGDGWQDCPVTDDVSGRLIRLPFYNTLSEVAVDRVCSELITSLKTAR